MQGSGWIRSALVVGAVVAGSVWTSADATTLIRRSTEELTVLSEAVVQGRVTGIEAKWHEEHKFVYTYVTLEVDEVFKGSSVASTIVLEELGGAANGVTVTVPSVPEFELDEDVIVFLDVVNGNYRCHGFNQGKFSVQSEGGELRVTRPLEVEQTFNWSRDGELDSTVEAGTGVRPYDRFVATIEAWKDRLALPGGGQ